MYLASCRPNYFHQNLGSGNSRIIRQCIQLQFLRIGRLLIMKHWKVCNIKSENTLSESYMYYTIKTVANSLANTTGFSEKI